MWSSLVSACLPSSAGKRARFIVYNKTLLAFAAHHGFAPKACRPNRAKTKGKVERRFRYVRQDFFLDRSFRSLEDLNRQFEQWRDEVANARCHATTRRIVAEYLAEERPSLKPLPAGPFCAVLSLERRITRDGTVFVSGNLYSVPDCTRRRAVEVPVLADEIRIFEDEALIASHPVLDGRGLRRIADRRLQAPLDAFTDLFAIQPGAPSNGRQAHALLVMIKDHDNVPKCDHRALRPYCR